MARTFSLSLAAADIVAELLEVNIRLFPFEIPSVGAFQVDRQRIERVVLIDLAKRGLVRDNDFDPDLKAALHALSSYAIAVAVMGTVEKDREIYARASAVGKTGVLVVKEDQTLRFELIRPTALAATLAGLLPRALAGPGQSVTIRRPAPARHRRDDDQQSVFGQQVRSTSEQQLRAATAVLARPRTGTGFFAVSGRDRYGREVDAGGLSWLDTDAGRYLTLSRPADEDGTVTGTLFPADSTRLTQQLAEMIQSVAPDPRLVGS
jgi:ESX secretion-associated protein EspG